MRMPWTEKGMQICRSKSAFELRMEINYTYQLPSLENFNFSLHWETIFIGLSYNNQNQMCLMLIWLYLYMVIHVV